MARGRGRQFLGMVFLACSFFAWSDEAHAQRTQPGVAQIPVQIGVGPAGFILGGPTSEMGFGSGLTDDQFLHTGLRVSITAVITEEVIRRHPNLVPRNYRQQIANAGEFRIAPSVLALIPTSLIISPPILGDGQAYGATWGLFGVGLPFSTDPVRISLNAAVIGTVMYINSPSLAQEHYIFARPGAELRFDVEIPIETDFRISLGASTQVYLPQTLEGTGADSFGAGEFLSERSLWNISQIYIQGQFRVPYSYRYGG